MENELRKIEEEVIQCKKCPRLAAYIREVAVNKVRRYRDKDYWGRPVPGFGDPDPRVVIIGLAPGAHGANRTGRMFTGDDSGNWLYKAMYESGFASQPTSTDTNDGLTLTGAFVTAPVRCAPPGNKPTAAEIHTCTPYLSRELDHFKNIKVIICLGGIAFSVFKRLAGLKGIKFGHHSLFQLEDGKLLISSYHPSRQNTNTGRLKWPEWLQVFQTAREYLSSGENHVK